VQDLLAELNDQQRLAAETTEGPVLILAGAGSGKTKALTHRIAYLVAQQHVRPLNILAVTFTNKAAAEMRGRVLRLLGQDPANRNYFPFIGTFHSICLRLLRREATEIGLASNFLVFDSADSQSAIKRSMRHLGIDEKQFTPGLIHGLISSAKNELISASQYQKLASGKAQVAASQVYPLYQKTLKDAGALDFDDLIYETVMMLRNHPDILAKYQQQFQYIMVDEYQDTNHAQYQITKLLASSHHNICVVGDDWQCYPEGTLVETPTGPRPIEQVMAGDEVTSASGYGKTAAFRVTRTHRSPRSSELVRITTASGRTIDCTPSHVLFARWENTSSYVVYLMFAEDKGYRIGVAKGTRFDGQKHVVGMRVRANQERADRMWVMRVCDTRSEAMFMESLYAAKYGIPMTRFRAAAGVGAELQQEQLDDIFGSIDTTKRAFAMMQELELSYDHPHFTPEATTRGGSHRVHINLVLFGDRRTTVSSPWSASRISANTSQAEDLSFFESVGYSVRSGRAGTVRTGITNLDYGNLEKTLAMVMNHTDKLDVKKFAFITETKSRFMPASQIHPGMVVASLDGATLVDDTVVAVERVPHDSIYSWRGANFQNILDFEKDYPSATVVKLEQNYRSTKRILDAAHAVISKNRVRSTKSSGPKPAMARASASSTSTTRSRKPRPSCARSKNSAAPKTASSTTLPCSTAPTPSRARWKRPSCATTCRTKSSAAPASTSAKKSKTPWPTCALCTSPTTSCPSAASSTCPPRGLGDVSLTRLEAWRVQQGLSSWKPCAVPTSARASRPRRSTPCAPSPCSSTACAPT
jgi:DNA helicase-2/ATP-dependent DNA helicase PcrA